MEPIKKLKVVAFGSVNGNFTTLTKKMSVVNTSKAGPFDLFLISGNLFKPTDTNELDDIQVIDNRCIAEDLVSGEFKFPVPTYFISGGQPLPYPIQSRLSFGKTEICPNLNFLGKNGVITTTDGVKIAFLGGTKAPEGIDPEIINDSNHYEYYDGAQVADIMLAQTPQYIDILLTFDWPTNLTNVSVKASQIPAISEIEATSEISTLAKHFKPKYHFSTSNPAMFFEREPYSHAVQGEDRAGGKKFLVTRFIGLADVGSETDRWYYAMNLILGPKLFMEPELPALTTECPFDHVGQTRPKRPATDQAGQFSYFYSSAEQPPAKRALPKNYVCKLCEIPGHLISECPTNPPKARNDRIEVSSMPPEGYLCNKCQVPGHWKNRCPSNLETASRAIVPEQCWFCLVNSDVSRNLIVSIGEEIYSSIAKGSLIDPENPSSKVPGGGNLLLLPIPHYASLHDLAPETLKPLEAELQNYKDALKKFFDSYDCSPVYFEISRPGPRQHAHLQVVPVPKELMGQVKEQFVKQAHSDGFELVENFEPSSQYPYIRVQIDEVHLAGNVPRGVKFNLAFGRQVLASVLNIPDRVDWRQCAFNKEQEDAMQKEFSDAFKSFDPFA